MFTVKKHKVAKKDTLVGIAKKYKHKSWKTIWDDKRNAAVKKKRGKPEAIEPGDVLIIPFNDAEKKAIAAERDRLIARLSAENVLAEAISIRVDRQITAGKNAIKRHADIDKSFKDTIAMLRGCQKDSKKWKDGVDVTYKVVTLLRGLKGLAKTSQKASKATGDELAKLNKEAQSQAVSMMTGPVKGVMLDAGIKYLLNDKNEISEIGTTVGAIAKWWGELETPSFWAGAITQLADGKSWEEAFQHDFEVEIKSKVHVVDKQRIFATKKLLLQAQTAVKSAEKMQGDIKAAIKRSEALVKELDALPSP